MSMDFNIRPVGAPVATPIAPPASEAAHHAVATELPTPQERHGGGRRRARARRFRLRDPFVVASGGD